MRKAYLLAVPVLALTAAAGTWFALHESDPIAAAKRRMARSDMRGAELYLRRAVQLQPNSGEAAFLLGKVDLALANPQAAELELRRADKHGYPHVQIVLPLGQAYLQQRHFEAALRDFAPDRAPAAELVDTLTIRSAAELSLGETKAATDTINQALAVTVPPARPSRDTLLTAARIALATDDLAATQAHAAQILAAEPDQPEAVLLQAEVAMRRNDLKLALALAQKVLAATPARLDARLIEARALASLDRADAARASVGQVLRSAPKNVGANYLNAMLAIQAGDYPAADASLTAISTAVSQLPRGFYFLAVTKLGMGQPAQAEEAATKFLSKQPDDIAGLKLMAYIDLARLHQDQVLSLLRTSALATHPDADTLDLQGRAQAMGGDTKGAEASLRKAAILAPSDIQILNRLAAAQLSLGDAAGAEADLKHSLEIAPNQRLAGEAVVQAALARGDVAEATADVERLRKRIGDAEEVGVLAAQVRIAALDMDGAERQLRDVLARFPESRPATLNLVRIDGLRGNAEDAQKLLEDMLRRHPDDGQALDVLLPTLFATHQMERAVAVAEAAHQAAPDNVGITAALATTYVRAKQAGRAVGLLHPTTAQSNPHLDPLRARVLRANGQTQMAEDAYRTALQSVPANLAARDELAALLVAGMRYDDARQVLRDGLALSPGNQGLLGGLVGVDYRAHGVQAALATAAALRADPQNLPAANSLPGDVWRIQGDLAKAAAAYLAAFRSAPSGELATKAASAMADPSVNRAGEAIATLSGWVATHPDDLAAQSVLSSLDLQANRLAEAETHLDAVLAQRHTDAATLNNLAWVKQQQGDKAAARSLAERAYFQTPAPQVADTLGWILAQQGDTAQALMLLQQAAINQQGDERAASQYHYGWALNAAGRTGEARTQLQAAVAGKGDYPGKEDARRLLAGLK